MKLNSLTILTSLLLLSLLVSSCTDGGSCGIVPPITSIASAGPETLWMVGKRGQLFKKGIGHEAVEVPSPGKPETVFFLDESRGWAYEEGRHVWYTGDAGATWEKRGSHPEFGLGSIGIAFVDEMNGWILFWFGAFWTADGGSSWNLAYPTRDHNRGTATTGGMSVVDRDTVWIGMSDGTVLSTRNRGVGWSQFRPMPGHADIKSIKALADGRVWVGPGGGSVTGLYYTSDSGRTWQQMLDDEVRTNFGQTAIGFTPSGIGWLAGIEFVRNTDTATDGKGVVFRTNDGARWERQRKEVYSIPFSDVAFGSESNGWMLGSYRDERSYIYATRDGGNTWTPEFELKDSDVCR